LPDTYFEVKMYQKRLAAGLARIRWRSIDSASSEPLTAISGQGMEQSLAEIRGDVWLGLVGKCRVRSLGGMGRENRESGWENVFKPHHCQRLHFRFKMCQKMFGGRAPPGPAGGA